MTKHQPEFGQQALSFECIPPSPVVHALLVRHFRLGSGLSRRRRLDRLS